MLNYVLPYKLGDIVRAVFAGRKLKNKYALSFSTVIIDRYLDVICVGIIFAVFSLSGYTNKVIMGSAVFYMVVSVAALAVAGLLYLSGNTLKKAACAIARIFNTNIEAWLLEVV